MYKIPGKGKKMKRKIFLMFLFCMLMAISVIFSACKPDETPPRNSLENTRISIDEMDVPDCKSNETPPDNSLEITRITPE